MLAIVTGIALLPGCDLGLDITLEHLGEGRPSVHVLVDGDGGLAIGACISGGWGSCIERGELTAEAAGETTKLAFEPDPYHTQNGDGEANGRYVGHLAADAPGTEVVVTWDDLGEQEGRWSITIPDAFDITAPLDGAVIVGGPDVAIAWRPSGRGDAMRIGEGTSCYRGTDPNGRYGSARTFPIEGDTGAFTYRAGVAAFAPGEGCAIDFEVRRVRTGSPCDQLPCDGDVLDATQVRRVSFEVVGPPAPAR